MIYYTYIIYSKKIDKFYIGYSANIEDRLRKHNTNNKSFTGKANDWEIVYTQTFEKKTDAIIREKQIKNWKSRKRIEDLISSFKADPPDL